MSTSYETSAAIVAGIGKGDRAAEQAMIKKYARALGFILEKRTRDKERAKDLQQDTFLVVLEKLRKEPLQDPSKLAAYLQQTAINLYIGETRKLARRKTTADTELLEAVASSEGEQYTELVRERERAAVHKLVSELNNARDKKILTMYYIEERDKEAICQELNLGLRHFDRVISRARNRFKQLLMASSDYPLQEVVS